MTRLSALGLLAAALAFFGEAASAKDWESPPYKYLYEFPLPVPPVKEPKMTVQSPVTGKPIDYYEINIKPFQKKVYPNLRGSAGLVGYDGMAPGPTFRMKRGREAVVRFVNNGPRNSAVHLHGSYTRAPWDGWAEDVITPGQYKDYYYPNGQNGRTMWYHDHAVDITAVNAYHGQAGVYILADEAEDALGLPNTYGVDDIPLVLTSVQFNADGTLYSPANEKVSLFGDVIQVNGQPWPYFRVKPKKYRFRLLDAAVSRSFILYFTASGGSGARNLPFKVIASDAGLLTRPVEVTNMAISMGERYEIVFDFSPFAGRNVTLQNQEDVGADTDYLRTNQVMRFVVANTPAADTTVVPSALRTVPWPAGDGALDQRFRFERTGGLWKINGVTFADRKNRVLARPPRGTVETWELVNTGGGWSHPVHVHLVDFRVVSRSGGKRGAVMPYEAEGLKDVVWLSTGETVRVEAHYAPWDGLYMFHCHNLVHEDHEMMAAFNVTQLADLGYNETAFLDPMEPRWRAVPYKPADFAPAAVADKIRWMAGLVPYSHVDEVEEKLAEYWSSRGGSRVRRRIVVGGDVEGPGSRVR